MTIHETDSWQNGERLEPVFAPEFAQPELSRLSATELSRMENLPSPQAVDKLFGSVSLVSAKESHEQHKKGDKSGKDDGQSKEDERRSKDGNGDGRGKGNGKDGQNDDVSAGIDQKARQDHIQGEIAYAKSDGIEQPERFVQDQRARMEKMTDQELEKERLAIEAKLKQGTVTAQEHTQYAMIMDIESERYQAKHK